ncbi:hypothetical protein AWV79_02450 [Cupriavidus sp. UYMMa02A]|nr:hypothetical protein AWV79_02450 [Cupriavidus sp. UYMMa02A]
MVAIGACAGFSAQLAVWQALIQRLNRDPGDFLVHVNTKSNESFVYGESINQFLFVCPPDRLSFLSVAAGNLRSDQELPDIRELAAHVMRTVGTEEFGVPRYPAPDEIAELPRMALEKTFQIVAHYFQRDAYPTENWPALLGAIAFRIIDSKKHLLAPARAIRMLLESAVPMSKIDPSMVKGINLGIDWRLADKWSSRARTIASVQAQADLINEVRRAMPNSLERH